MSWFGGEGESCPGLVERVNHVLAWWRGIYVLVWWRG